jgi:hypothetical protein
MQEIGVSTPFLAKPGLIAGKLRRKKRETTLFSTRLPIFQGRDQGHGVKNPSFGEKGHFFGAEFQIRGRIRERKGWDSTEG